MTFFTHLRCSSCKKTFPAHSTVCPDCGKALLAEYDLHEAKKSFSKKLLKDREKSLWRYGEVLPLDDAGAIVSFGEGWTPMLKLPHLGQALGFRNILLKDEGLNPTGSFKARGISVAVSMAKKSGVSDVALPSAGNAGGAVAAYAARAGMKAHVFVPASTPVININEIAAAGAELTLVEGSISDAARRMNEERQGKGWFDMSTMKEPYRVEGKKTMGYEIAEQLGWSLPDVILYPTGGGTGLIGMWKAFAEMEELGWISQKRPKMVSVQASGCAPIVKAFQQRKKESEAWPNPTTAAAGLRVPKAFADALILDALYESKGSAVAVTEEEWLADLKTAARLEGILLCPEGAAAIAALRKLKGFIRPDDTVVVFNTGSGYKYSEVLGQLTF